MPRRRHKPHQARRDTARWPPPLRTVSAGDPRGHARLAGLGAAQVALDRDGYQSPRLWVAGAALAAGLAAIALLWAVLA